MKTIRLSKKFIVKAIESEDHLEPHAWVKPESEHTSKSVPCFCAVGAVFKNVLNGKLMAELAPGEEISYGPDFRRYDIRDDAVSKFSKLVNNTIDMNDGGGTIISGRGVVKTDLNDMLSNHKWLSCLSYVFEATYGSTHSISKARTATIRFVTKHFPERISLKLPNRAPLRSTIKATPA
jgi:hypothetical protein